MQIVANDMNEEHELDDAGEEQLINQIGEFISNVREVVTNQEIDCWAENAVHAPWL